MAELNTNDNDSNVLMKWNCEGSWYSIDIYNIRIMTSIEGNDDQWNNIVYYSSYCCVGILKGSHILLLLLMMKMAKRPIAILLCGNGVCNDLMNNGKWLTMTTVWLILMNINNRRGVVCVNSYWRPIIRRNTVVKYVCVKKWPSINYYSGSVTTSDQYSIDDMYYSWPMTSLNVWRLYGLAGLTILQSLLFNENSVSQ